MWADPNDQEAMQAAVELQVHEKRMECLRREWPEEQDAQSGAGRSERVPGEEDDHQAVQPEQEEQERKKGEPKEDAQEGPKRQAGADGDHGGVEGCDERRVRRAERRGVGGGRYNCCNLQGTVYVKRHLQMLCDVQIFNFHKFLN